MNKRIIFFAIFIFQLSINAYCLPALNKGETLNATLEIDKLIVTIENKTDLIYFEKSNVLNFQISKDKRKILFQIYDDRFVPKAKLYLIDGNTGIEKELGLITTNWLADSNFRYLITEIFDSETEMTAILVKSIPEFLDIKKIIWLSLKQAFIENFAHDGTGFEYYFTLAENQDYEFVIYARGYHIQYGYGYLNLDNMEFLSYDENSIK